LRVGPRALLVAGARLEHGERLVASHDELAQTHAFCGSDGRGQRCGDLAHLPHSTRVDQDPQELDLVRKAARELELRDVMSTALGDLAPLGVRAQPEATVPRFHAGTGRELVVTGETSVAREIARVEIIRLG